jgi:hypothetical protein
MSNLFLGKSRVILSFMPRPVHLADPPFLSPEYEAAITPSEGMPAIHQMLVNPEKASLRGLIKQLYVVSGQTTEQHRFMKEHAAGLPRSIRNLTQLDNILQYKAATTIMQYENWASMVASVATMTGAAEVVEPQSVELGHEIGTSLIESRAQHAASSLIRASGMLYSTVGRPSKPELSVWDRCNESVTEVARRKLRSPKISDEAHAAYVARYNEAFEDDATERRKIPMPVSRFRAITIVRGVHMGVQTMRGLDRTQAPIAYQMSGIRATMDVLLGAMPKPVELDPAAIRSSVALLAKLKKILSNTAIVNPYVASDPAARYFAFVFDRLEGNCAVNTEQEIFARQVKRAAVQKREAIETGAEPEADALPRAA